MRVSYVIPVYRTEQYLPRCLDSLVAQSDGDFEAIVVDDCSPSPESKSENGATASEIVARYDSRFKCIRQDRNRSTFQAKATGARAATGDYIVPLDSDDYVLPGLVRELKREIDRHSSDNSQLSTLNSQLDLIVYQMVKEYRGRTYPVKYNHPRYRCSGEEALDKLFSGRIFMPVCGKAIRREVFLTAYEGLGVGPDFYLNFTDDLCWLLPILFNVKTVSFIPYKGYRYWRHDDSMTKDVMAEERVRSLAEQSRRSVETVIAYARRLGKDERTIAQIRAQLYPTIRWLMRDRGQGRAALEAVYGADLVAETIAWDESSGGSLVKMVRHLIKFGVCATVREVAARIRGIEI